MRLAAMSRVTWLDQARTVCRSVSRCVTTSNNRGRIPCSYTAGQQRITAMGLFRWFAKRAAAQAFRLCDSNNDGKLQVAEVSDGWHDHIGDEPGYACGDTCSCLRLHR